MRRALYADLTEQLCAQRRRRWRLRSGCSDGGHNLSHIARLAPAAVALREMGEPALLLLAFQQSQGIQRSKLFPLGMAEPVHIATEESCSRRRCIPVRIRVFTVPSGWPNFSASS